MPPPGYGGPPQPPRPWPPYPGAPQPPTPRNRLLPLIIGAAVLFFVLVSGITALIVGGSGSSSSSSSSQSGFGFNFFGGDRIAVLEIEGVLGEGPGYPANTKVLVRHVREWTNNKNIKAIVLRINSPGGAVSATQDLYEALQDFRATNRPVVASMGDVAASGGYYAAMAADEVYANPGTLTGSVGVIMSFLNLEGLQQKIGITSRNVKSGEFKDIGSASRPMTEAEQALLTEMVVDVFEQFFESVVEARRDEVIMLVAHERGIDVKSVTEQMVEDHLRQYCDGRIFTGRQAKEYGMVDSLGTFQKALERAAQLANVPATTSTVVAPVRPRGLFGAANAVANTVQQIQSDPAGGVRLEYRLAWW